MSGVGDVDDDTTCRIVEIDGEPVRVQGAGEVTDVDRSAPGEVVRAAQAKLATMPPGPLMVDCPTCGASAGALCRRESNPRFGRAPHTERREAVRNA